MCIRDRQRQPQKENRTFETAQQNRYPVTEQETKQPERSNEYGRDHIQQAGRLQPAESSAPAGAGSGSWEIRITAVSYTHLVTGGIDYGIENDHCGSIGTLYPRRADLSQGQKPEEVIQRGGGFAGPPLYICLLYTSVQWHRAWQKSMR